MLHNFMVNSHIVTTTLTLLVARTRALDWILCTLLGWGCVSDLASFLGTKGFFGALLWAALPGLCWWRLWVKSNSLRLCGNTNAISDLISQSTCTANGVLPYSTPVQAHNEILQWLVVTAVPIMRGSEAFDETSPLSSKNSVNTHKALPAWYTFFVCCSQW